MLSKMVEAVTETMGVQVIPIDGKTVRQSFDRERWQKPCRQRLGKYIAWLGQLQVDSKSNEITAIRNYWSC